MSAKHATGSGKSSIVKTIIAAVVLVTVLAAVIFAFSFAWKTFSGGSNGPQRPVTIEISEGMTAAQIADKLEKKNVIKSAFVFRMYIKNKGVEADFKPGAYDLKTNMDYEEVIKVLTAGPKISYVKITLPEGWTAKQMAVRISKLSKISKEEYLQMVDSGQTGGVEYAFLTNNGAQTKSFEGYLYPDTYKVEEKTTTQDLIDMQLEQFQKETAMLNWANTQALGRTPYDIIKISSLIERETLVDSERPMVASVIYNRLKKGMLLQIDATVQYALPEWKERLTYEDLKVDSPYNTYKYPGLPPGPICNPSRDSINAALNPAATNYLYYVLAPDNSGKHVFTNTYDEFLKAKAQYQQAQRNRQSMQNQQSQENQDYQLTEDTSQPLN